MIPSNDDRDRLCDDADKVVTLDDYEGDMMDIKERLRVGSVSHHQVSKEWEEYESVARQHKAPAIQLEAADHIASLELKLADAMETIEQLKRRPNPANGAPKPANHKPFA